MFVLLSEMIIYLTFVLLLASLNIESLHANIKEIPHATKTVNSNHLILRRLLGAEDLPTKSKSENELFPLFFTLDPECTSIEMHDKIGLDVAMDITVGQLKIEIMSSIGFEPSFADDFVLFYGTELLEDEDMKVSATSISADSTVHLNLSEKKRALNALRAMGINESNYQLTLFKMEDIFSEADEHLPVLILIGEAGLDLNIRCNSSAVRNTLLLHVMSDPDLRLAWTMMKYGADVSLVNDQRCTVLQVAVCNNQVDVSMIEYIVSKGARVNALDIHGIAALDFAEHHASAEIQAYLRSVGAKKGEQLRSALDELLG